LKLVEQAHGLKISRLLGELDIDSAGCLIAVDIFSLIQNDKKFMSIDSREYVFEDGTNNFRVPVKYTLQRFVQQMKEIDHQASGGKRPRLTGKQE
jgi:hypothetical protein